MQANSSYKNVAYSIRSGDDGYWFKVYVWEPVSGWRPTLAEAEAEAKRQIDNAIQRGEERVKQGGW